jgi:hypothetical protein
MVRAPSVVAVRPVWCDALRYDVLRSATPADFLDATACVESDGTDTTAFDGDVPATGEAFYYVVRAVNACPPGEGPIGDGDLARHCP